MPLMMTENATVHEQVALWIVHLASGEASDADHRMFENWLAEDLSRRQEYQRATRLWAGMEGAEELAGMVAVSGLQAKEPEGMSATLFAWLSGPWLLGWGVNRAFAATAVAFAIVVTGFLAVQYDLHLLKGSAHATEVAEIRDIVLPDGSLVTLGARSSITTDFTEEERRVTLGRGEAFFAVEKDVARPFIVVAGDTRVRVVGTKFDMRHGVDEVKVSVLEGRVEVERISQSEGTPDIINSGTGKTKNILTAGQETISVAGGVTIVRERLVQKVATWRSGRLVYANETLREVVADANRYYDGEIILASRELGDLRVTASFKSGQVEQMIRSLSVALALQIDRTDGNHIVLRR